ncbi:MAG: hypothetical protein WCA07_03000 [Gloeobacterales cyanobacterium]
MLKAKNFQTVILQATIFTPDISVSTFSASKALAIILGKYAQQYDGAPQALALPEGIPPEIPRIVLQSQDGTFKLEIAPQRINSFWIRTQENQGEPENMIDSCIEVLKHYVRETDMNVGRLALIVTRALKTEYPAKSLIEKFCKQELQTSIFGRSENFEIHNHKRYGFKGTSIENLFINSWLRCKTGEMIADGKPVPAIILEQDLNTPLEEIEQRNFTTDEIQNYFEQTADEAKSVLELYFPSGD